MELSEKTLERWRKTDIALHKKVIITELKIMGAKYRTINKVLVLYDLSIDHHNILLYYNRPIRLFINALIRDKLNEISDYNSPKVKLKKKRRRKCTQI